MLKESRVSDQTKVQNTKEVKMSPPRKTHTLVVSPLDLICVP
jgi:hypothetical protein